VAKLIEPGITKGEWKWWTSNSWRRLRSDQGHGRDENVLEPFTAASDGHPDCVISNEDMQFIAASPRVARAAAELLNVTRAVEHGSIPNIGPNLDELQAALISAGYRESPDAK